MDTKKIITGMFIISTIMGCSIHKKAAKERAEMLQQLPQSAQIIRAADLERLPQPVKQWLASSGVVGKKRTQTAFVEQTLRMKLKPNQEKWYQGKANQIFTIWKPGFNWMMKMKMSPVMNVKARDKFANGNGEMHIKMNNIITIAKAQGPKIDEASLQRFLGEMVWFPSAALSDHINWETIDSTSARATITINDIEASGTFNFNTQGEVVSFSAMRYKDTDAEAKRQLWINTIEKIGVINGIRVPVKTSTTWRLDDGDWTWLKLEITDIKLNPAIKQITNP
ncbi:hypothetical protein L21SP5_02019 [Salinivirga cyanobacteriivorans]|uniref:Lipoprotein n=1 Tax=Salinivirga cyanobacteriivorans TaxID=1307839 RepID=A0A0S2I006_9BACT|nr:DUF6544 family protein [Salinivirga cyanobacteriivorans]ALO15658.1 hypothetical protein L21SP5_02019 [Salinivirga cyanobacteriivorans]